MWFTWTTETLPEDRRAVLVELSLFAVFPQVLQESAMRFSDLRTDRSRCKQNERSTSHVLGRHSRVHHSGKSTIPWTKGASGVFAGQSHRSARIEQLRFRLRNTHPKECGPCLRCREGQAPDGNGAGCPRVGCKRCAGRWPKPPFDTCADASDCAVRRTLAEAAVRHGARSRVTARCEHRRNELHLNPSRSAGTGASSARRERPKPQTPHRSYPVGGPMPKQRTPARVPPGRGCATGPAEAGLPKRACRSGLDAHRHPANASHARTTEVDRERKTRSGNSTTTPMGFGSFRRMNPGDRCAGLPSRHHPLSEFLTLSAV
jgi:hypothetical protein